jgi:transposase
MFYAGLDVSDACTSICVVDQARAVVIETQVATSPAAIATALRPYRKALAKVGHETGAKAPWLHKELTKRRLPIVCLDARHTHAQLSAQRNKTDRNDARGIAGLLCSGVYTEAHVKSDEAQRIRLLLTHRIAMKRKARDIENALRMSLKTFGARLEKSKAGVVTVKQATRHQDPVLTRLSEAMLRASAALLAEVEALDRLTTTMAKADPVCRRLMTAPGVGPITALAFKSGVDDPNRFSSSRTVAAHFGLTPRRFQSGGTDYSGRISKMGDCAVRSALYEAAFVMLNVSKSKCALRTWGLRLRSEKGMGAACVACARKLAVILHRMWITERDFDAENSQS